VKLTKRQLIRLIESVLHEEDKKEKIDYMGKEELLALIGYGVYRHEKNQLQKYNIEEKQLATLKIIESQDINIYDDFTYHDKIKTILAPNGSINLKKSGADQDTVDLVKKLQKIRDELKDKIKEKEGEDAVDSKIKEFDTHVKKKAEEYLKSKKSSKSGTSASTGAKSGAATQKSIWKAFSNQNDLKADDYFFGVAKLRGNPGAAKSSAESRVKVQAGKNVGSLERKTFKHDGADYFVVYSEK
jgi:hypothetical protein